MSLHARALHARLPWPGGHGVPEEAVKEPAPRTEARYVCAGGCRFTVPFAAGAEVPETWNCRCGQPARLEGAPEGTEGYAVLPGYATPGTGKYERGTKSPQDHLHERRSGAEGAALLAERLAEVRRTGAAR